jgi:hypothetical protein
MASTVTLGAMRNAARQRANQETLDQAQALVTDVELNGIINNGARHVYRLLVRARSGFYRKDPPQAIATVSGTSAYALASDFLEIISVDWQFSATEVEAIYPYEEPERNRFKRAPGWIRTYPTSYQLQGNKINFVPTPTAVYAVSVNYVPTYSDLVNDADTFDGIEGYEEYAICKAAAYLCYKDDNAETAQAHESQAAMIENEVKTMAPNRSAGLRRVQRVRAARKRGDGVW